MPATDDQVKELREDIREGFKSVNARIDNLVTRSELKAELRRVDEKHEAHVLSTAKGFSDIASQIRSISSTTKWAVGITVTVVALVFTIVRIFVP